MYLVGSDNLTAIARSAGCCLVRPSVTANETLWTTMTERGWGELDRAGIIRVIEEDQARRIAASSGAILILRQAQD
jgi:hypothetical protein